VTAHTYDSGLTAPAREFAAHRLRGAALVAMLLILVAIAAAVLMTAEWMAPASSSVGVPG
jgi:hypothetical protein